MPCFLSYLLIFPMLINIVTFNIQLFDTLAEWTLYFTVSRKGILLPIFLGTKVPQPPLPRDPQSQCPNKMQSSSYSFLKDLPSAAPNIRLCRPIYFYPRDPQHMGRTVFLRLNYKQYPFRTHMIHIYHQHQKRNINPNRDSHLVHSNKLERMYTDDQ